GDRGQRADHRDRDVDGLGGGAAIDEREGDLLRLGGDVAGRVEHLELAVGADDVAGLDQLAVEAVLDVDVEGQLAGVVAHRAQPLDAVYVDLEVLDAVLDLGAAELVEVAQALLLDRVGNLGGAAAGE